MKLCRSRRNAVPARWHRISLNTKRKSCTRNHPVLCIILNGKSCNYWSLAIIICPSFSTLTDPTADSSGYGRRRGRRRRRIWILLSMTERHCYSSSFRSPSLYFTFVFLSRAFVVDQSEPAELFWIHVKCGMNMIWKRPLVNLICQSLQANLDCIYRGDNANVDELNIIDVKIHNANALLVGANNDDVSSFACLVGVDRCIAGWSISY